MSINQIAATPRTVKYRIEAMDCPVEENLIRQKLSNMPDIDQLDFNLVQRVLTIRHLRESAEDYENAIRDLGFKPVIHQTGISNRTPDDTKSKQNEKFREWFPIILGGITAVASELPVFASLVNPWLGVVLALAAVVLTGLTTYKKGWISLWNRNLNINALMSIAVTGAFIMRQWSEAAMVMVLFAIAEKIEAYSLDKARNAISGLLDLSPAQASMKQADGTWSTVSAAAVPLGSWVKAGPGERISHDGEIMSGNTSLDQSPITGESMPVDRTVGDQVFAGTINLQGEIILKVSAAATDSLLSRIIHMVEEAQSQRSQAQRFVDQFAKVYTPLVVIGAILVAVLPPLLMNGVWMAWIYKALVLLIIACPCALVISTPVAIVSALAKAARLGIIVKGGLHLEQAGRLNMVVFDKTGTITTGTPTQSDALILSGSREDSLAIARSLAARSDHPVSRAISAEASGTLDKSWKLHDVLEFTALPGKGVKGSIQGTAWYLGNHRLIEELGCCSAELEAHLDRLEDEGKTCVILADGKRSHLVVAVADGIKPNSPHAIGDLRRLGVASLMLSGDNARTVEHIGRAANVDESRGEQLPQDKLAAIKKLQGMGKIVAMVGDGINDAPALAQANLGIAMGANGTGIAIETADVVLMDDDLAKVPLLIGLSRRTKVILIQNITLALGIKVVFLALTVLGLGTMWMAVFADMGASLIVVFNSLRLMTVKKL